MYYLSLQIFSIRKFCSLVAIAGVLRGTKPNNGRPNYYIEMDANIDCLWDKYVCLPSLHIIIKVPYRNVLNHRSVCRLDSQFVYPCLILNRTEQRLIRLIDPMVFNTVFNVKVPYNVLSKPLAAFPHNHSPSNGQR